MTKTLIQFEDHGQDFLWWVVDEAGKVIDCGPFQGFVWLGFTVTNLHLVKPGVLVLCSRHGEFVSVVRYPAALVMPLEPIDTLVRMQGDGYVTATVKGKRSSCTSSAREAVLSLGRKVFQDHFDQAECLPGQPGDHDSRIHSRWRITPKEVV